MTALSMLGDSPEAPMDTVSMPHSFSMRTAKIVGLFDA